MPKMQSLLLTHLIDKDGKRHYRVESVTNSAEYYPQQMLEIEEVTRLCADNAWQVQVVSTESMQRAANHTHP